MAPIQIKYAALVMLYFIYTVYIYLTFINNTPLLYLI